MPGFSLPMKKIIIYLLLCSLTIMFLGLTFSYLYQKITVGLSPSPLPRLFLLNSFLLIGTSFFMHQANLAYQRDNTQNYTRYLILTFLISLLFMIFQFFAWSLLWKSGVFINNDPSTSYLYLISGLHFLHVFGGLPPLVYFIYVAIKRMKEPVSVLIYFSDPSKKMNLQLLTIYWHFLDVLWIYLVLFFTLINLF